MTDKPADQSSDPPAGKPAGETAAGPADKPAPAPGATPDTTTAQAGGTAGSGPAGPSQGAGASPGSQAGARTPESTGGLPQTAAAAAAARAEVVEVRRGMFGVSGTGDTSGYGRLVRPVTLPASSPRPYGSYFDDVADRLVAALDAAGVPLDEAIERVVVDRGELTFHVRRDRLVEVAQRLRDDQDLRFELCLGVSGVHYPADAGRELHAVYHLLSITHNRRIRLEVAAPDADPHLPSLVAVYPTNDWHERETYDFFGIIFDGHPSLTRIEMPDDWPGHPQRKDYPLGGIPVEYKGAQIPPPDERRSYN